jgi:hypothetical protein
VFNPGTGYAEQRTHRWSLILTGVVIPKGLNSLHHCDNPPCVRPKHLYLGTHGQNVADKIAKDRHARGERVSGAKLTASDVLTIRERAAGGGVSLAALAREYGIWMGSIWNIVHRRTWKHL